MKGLENPAIRLEKLQAQLEDARQEVAARREEVGAAVVDTRSRAANKLRNALAKAEARLAELEAAIPVAEARVRRIREREGARKAAEDAKRANEIRKRRLKAAHKVDAAWSALAEAFAEYAATDASKSTDVRQTLASQCKITNQAAAYRWCPQLARLLEIPVPAGRNRASLAEAEAALIPELTVDEKALAG